MRIYIYTLEKTIYEEEASSVTLPAEGGEISILPEHVPLVTALQKGKITSRNNSQEKEFEIAGGFAYADGKNLVVLAD